MKGQFKARGRAIIASLLVGIVLLLDAMAACPALHELIHKDAGNADHECAVTMFAHGKVDSVSVEAAVSESQAFVAIFSPVEISTFSPAIGHLPAGRGPPVSCIAS